MSTNQRGRGGRGGRGGRSDPGGYQSKGALCYTCNQMGHVSSTCKNCRYCGGDHETGKCKDAHPDTYYRGADYPLLPRTEPVTAVTDEASALEVLRSYKKNNFRPPMQVPITADMPRRVAARDLVWLADLVGQGYPCEKMDMRCIRTRGTGVFRTS
jgi:hypothetical protein